MFKNASKHNHWLANEKNCIVHCKETNPKKSIIAMLEVNRLLIVNIAIIRKDKISITMDNGNILGEMEYVGRLSQLKYNDKVVVKLLSKGTDSYGKIYLKTDFVKKIKLKLARKYHENISISEEDIYFLILNMPYPKKNP